MRIAEQEKLLSRSVQFSPGQLEWLEEQASKRQISVSAVVRDALRMYQEQTSAPHQRAAA